MKEYDVPLALAGVMLVLTIAMAAVSIPAAGIRAKACEDRGGKYIHREGLCVKVLDEPVKSNPEPVYQQPPCNIIYYTCPKEK